jgi:hypothetical protein
LRIRNTNLLHRDSLTSLRQIPDRTLFALVLDHQGIRHQRVVRLAFRSGEYLHAIPQPCRIRWRQPINGGRDITGVVGQVRVEASRERRPLFGNDHGAWSKRPGWQQDRLAVD